MFNKQFIYLARTVFGNPTLNSYFKFFKEFGFFYFTEDIDFLSMPYLSVHGMLRLHLD